MATIEIKFRPAKDRTNWEDLPVIGTPNIDRKNKRFHFFLNQAIKATVPKESGETRWNWADSFQGHYKPQNMAPEDFPTSKIVKVQACE
jgi:hypothetical protein